MKKLLAVALGFTLTFSVVLPTSFATSTNKEISEVEKKLINKGVSKEEITNLGKKYTSIIDNVLQSEDLSNEQLRNLVNGLLDRETDDEKVKKGTMKKQDGYKELPKHDFNMYKPKELIKSRDLKNEVSALASSPSEEHSTGVIRNVISQWGYSTTTMKIDLPSVYLNKTNDSSSYVFGGAYTKNPSTGMPYSGADLGVGTEDSSGRYWFPVIYLGLPGWDGKRLPGEDDDGWYQSPTVSIDKNQVQKLYMIVEANDDQLILSIFNGITYSEISSISMYAPGRYFTNEGQNVQLAQQASICYLARGDGTYNGYLQSGSYMRYATFSNVYIYNDLNLPNGTLWTSSYTSAITKGETTQAAAKINASVFSADYNHQVSINLN
ncbi:hypothetical protein QFZ81_003004 [Paenibacillus sp. V4I9]|uniref:hypothetical protein n=1 Tax=Paenibacillus sp. V4I9 TaxID=3042308 RepID=UPI0027857196|nr:hypothetical protein [Paenibacillus sp. V4I9]MDQ0887916.1 hypothetical protein [Paenibacillus sp. V4I9]